MPSFLEKFFPEVYKRQIGDQSTNQYCKFDSQTLTIFTSSLYLAALVASFFASYMTRRFGRRLSMLLGGFIFILGAALNGAAQDLAMLILGRILLGVGVGFASQSVPLYLSEIAPYKYRGSLNIGFQFMITIGILVANLVNYYTSKIAGGWGWRVSLGGAAVPGLMIGLGSFFVPDTPNSILERGHPVLFATLGFGGNAALLSSVITGGINVLATIVSIVSVDRLGRRFLFMEGGLQMLIFQLAIGVLIGAKFGTTGVATIGSVYAVVVVACICMFVTGFAWSWGPLGWLVPSEIFPLEIRSAAQSINVAVNMLFTFVVAEVFLKMLCTIKFGLFFFFAAFGLAMTLFIYFFLPETKGIPIEEMAKVWEDHWYWKRFVLEEEDDNNKPPSRSLSV